MTDKVSELERAILGQAERLADQYREQARSSCAEILQTARDHLHLREEREVLLAKTLAERSYRRQVLSQELAMQAKLDRLRWELVRSAQERLREELRQLTDDQPRYLKLLEQLIAQGVTQFDQDSLVIELNSQDRTLLSAHPEVLESAAGGKQLSLGDQPLDCSGGVLLRTTDNRERVDHTFEGRMHRLADALHRAIQDALLPPVPEDHSHPMTP